MTPSELNTFIRERYNAVGDSFFSDAFIYNGLFQAQQELALECEVIERTYVTTSVAGQREYSYPSTAQSIRRVEYKGVKLIPVDYIHDPKTSLTEPTGTPGNYAIWAQEVVLFPTPSVSDDQIKIFTFDRPSQVSVTSVLDVPEKYHLSLTDFVIYIMYAKEQNDRMAQYHLRLWEAAKLRIRKERARALNSDQFAVVEDWNFIPSHVGMDY